jgi:hypothetical protein
LVSLEAHGGYLAGIPGHPLPSALIPAITGEAMGG